MMSIIGGLLLIIGALYLVYITIQQARILAPASIVGTIKYLVAGVLVLIVLGNYLIAGVERLYVNYKNQLSNSIIVKDVLSVINQSPESFGLKEKPVENPWGSLLPTQQPQSTPISTSTQQLKPTVIPASTQQPQSTPEVEIDNNIPMLVNGGAQQDEKSSFSPNSEDQWYCLFDELEKKGMESSLEFGTDWLPSGTAWLLTSPGLSGRISTPLFDEKWTLCTSDAPVFRCFIINGKLAKKMGGRSTLLGGETTVTINGSGLWPPCAQ